MDHLPPIAHMFKTLLINLTVGPASVSLGPSFYESEPPDDVRLLGCCFFFLFFTRNFKFDMFETKSSSKC